MRPRRAFRPTGDALEARCVTSSLVPRHAPLHHAVLHHAPAHHAPAHHAPRHPAAHHAAAAPSVVLINLFPFAAGTTFISTTTTPTTTTTVLANTPARGGFGTGGTLFTQVGPGYGIISATTPVTYPGTYMGPGGDLNGLVLFGGPYGTAGGDLNGLVIY